MYTQEVREILGRMEKREAYLKAEIEKCPRGRLTCQKRKDGRALLKELRVKELRGKEARHRFAITNEPTVVRGLIRREAFEKELEALKRDAEALRKTAGRFAEISPGETAAAIEKRVGGLDDGTVRDALREGDEGWDGEAYEQSSFRPEERTHITSRGLAVRSKSELTIAEMLYRYGAAFRYEQIVAIGGKTFAPDFTIRRKDGTILYWEHLGMMARPDYARRQFEKIRTYAAYGIVPWENLILTFDDTDGNIDLRWIRAVIEARIGE